MKKLNVISASMLLSLCLACDNKHEKTRREMEQVVNATNSSERILLKVEE